MKALVLGFVLLAATAAQAEDRKCVRANERLCDTKNYVTNPNEYGWGATADRDCTPRRVKGFGWKQKKYVFCECLPDCRAEGE